jgi:hypothetical protein
VSRVARLRQQIVERENVRLPEAFHLEAQPVVASLDYDVPVQVVERFCDVGQQTVRS